MTTVGRTLQHARALVVDSVVEVQLLTRCQVTVRLPANNDLEFNQHPDA
jgi:hypothetical protein